MRQQTISNSLKTKKNRKSQENFESQKRTKSKLNNLKIQKPK